MALDCYLQLTEECSSLHDDDDDDGEKNASGSTSGHEAPENRIPFVFHEAG